MPKVLFGDDSPHARMGAEILGPEGLKVLGVTDGQEAIQSLARFAPLRRGGR